MPFGGTVSRVLAPRCVGACVGCVGVLAWGVLACVPRCQMSITLEEYSRSTSGTKDDIHKLE